MDYMEFWNLLRNTTPKYIIFLCAGNICRSPYAEMVFQKLLRENKTIPDDDFIIQSGGFIKQDTVKIHPFTQQALEEEEIEKSRILDHTPRQMRKHKEDLRQATALIVMTEEHRDILLAAKYRSKAILLSEAAANETINLPDPALYKDYRRYKELMDKIKAYLEQLIKKLEEFY
jgi:protein-tyrosine phosphatase